MGRWRWWDEARSARRRVGWQGEISTDIMMNVSNLSTDINWRYKAEKKNNVEPRRFLTSMVKVRWFCIGGVGCSGRRCRGWQREGEVESVGCYGKEMRRSRSVAVGRRWEVYTRRLGMPNGASVQVIWWVRFPIHSSCRYSLLRRIKRWPLYIN